MGKTEYYRIRGMNPNTLSETEMAARFIYLNRYCFNGLYRTNLKGQFNVPYGDHKGNHRIDEERIIQASAVLQNAQLICGDFEESLKYARRGDFVYLDPPYIVAETRVFSEYLENSFNQRDLDRLDEVLHRMNTQGILFIVTYADSAESKRLFRPWKTRRVQIRRNIAGFVGSRKVAYELIATNMG